MKSSSEYSNKLTNDSNSLTRIRVSEPNLTLLRLVMISSTTILRRMTFEKYVHGSNNVRSVIRTFFTTPIRMMIILYDKIVAFYKRYRGLLKEKKAFVRPRRYVSPSKYKPERGSV